MRYLQAGLCLLPPNVAILQYELPRKNAGKPKPQRFEPGEFFIPNDPETDPVFILQMRVQSKLNGDWEQYAFWMARWNALAPSVTNPHNVEPW